MKRIAVITLCLVLAVVISALIIRNYSRPNKSSSTGPATDQTKDQRFAPIPKIMDQNMSVPDPSEIIWQPIFDKQSRVIFRSMGVPFSAPQVEFRFWSNDNGKLIPWEGKSIDITCRSMRMSGYDAMYTDLEGFKDGHYNRPEMMVVVRAVRFALVSPDENLDKLKPPHIKHEVLRLGQEYGIDFRDHSGQIIGYNRIRIPEKVEENKVVVFDLVANK